LKQEGGADVCRCGLGRRVQAVPAVFSSAIRVQLASGDSFFAFKAHSKAFIGYRLSGVAPYLFAESVELVQLVIAGIRDRQVPLSEI